MRVEALIQNYYYYNGSFIDLDKMPFYPQVLEKYEAWLKGLRSEEVQSANVSDYLYWLIGFMPVGLASPVGLPKLHTVEIRDKVLRGELANPFNYKGIEDRGLRHYSPEILTIETYWALDAGVCASYEGSSWVLYALLERFRSEGISINQMKNFLEPSKEKILPIICYDKEIEAPYIQCGKLYTNNKKFKYTSKTISEVLACRFGGPYQLPAKLISKQAIISLITGRENSPALVDYCDRNNVTVREVLKYHGIDLPDFSEFYGKLDVIPVVIASQVLLIRDDGQIEQIALEAFTNAVSLSMSAFGGDDT